jgi:septal ring factor EnvC (AmiA/AmiB activator)
MLVVSLGLAVFYYFHYRLREDELTQYRNLSWNFEPVLKKLKKVQTNLKQNRKELNETLTEIARLNNTIATLRKDKLDFKAELKLLQEEKITLQRKIAQLTEEKSVWTEQFLALKKKLHSLKELKKAIRIVLREHKEKRKSERMQKRLSKIAMLKMLDEIGLQQGNNGYLVREGFSTYEPKIRVELEPVSKFLYQER